LNDTTGENRSTRRKTCPTATLSAANLIWIDLELNPILRRERPGLTATLEISLDLEEEKELWMQLGC
jgi:hypothetical protein